MMSKGEIAAYLGMANVMMSSVANDPEDPADNVMRNVRQALLEAQIYLTQEALREVLNEQGNK